jgi:hypothetical protein
MQERRESQTIEMLFERVGAFGVREQPAPQEIEPSGFRGIIFKGPFVEGSNWLSSSTWSYAVAMERHLSQRFERALRVAADGRDVLEVEREASAVLGGLDALARELVAQRMRPTLFVLAGELGAQVYRDVVSHIEPDWSQRVIDALRTTYRIIGMLGDVPVLSLPDTAVSAIYAVDLARFAALTRYGKQPEFRIEEFSEIRAREILARQPRLILDPPPESGLEDERVRQLQLRVGLDLWETYELTVKDPNAVVGRQLVGPILD